MNEFVEFQCISDGWGALSRGSPTAAITGMQKGRGISRMQGMNVLTGSCSRNAPRLRKCHSVAQGKSFERSPVDGRTPGIARFVFNPLGLNNWDSFFCRNWAMITFSCDSHMTSADVYHINVINLFRYVQWRG